MTTKEQITDWFCKRNKIKKEELDKYHRYAIATVFKYAQEQVIHSVNSRFSLTDNQIETIADLFSKRECLAFEEQDTEWLLSHAFQLGMKAYRDLLNGC